MKNLVPFDEITFIFDVIVGFSVAYSCLYSLNATDENNNNIKTRESLDEQKPLNSYPEVFEIQIDIGSHIDYRIPKVIISITCRSIFHVKNYVTYTFLRQHGKSIVSDV